MFGQHPHLGGVAVVCCVHDREKRQVIGVDGVNEAGREFGFRFDVRKHLLHHCACCDNSFVGADDEPKFCHACRGPLFHSLGGPLPTPIGVLT